MSRYVTSFNGDKTKKSKIKEVQILRSNQKRRRWEGMEYVPRGQYIRPLRSPAEAEHVASKPAEQALIPHSQ